MNWTLVSTLGPWAWVLFCVPVCIVLLYFLKLRREPVTVSSTYLWAKTIEDLHVNSLLQRLRRSLLLLLQLLAVLFAIIAVFRPGIRGTTTQQERLIFLLDCSASMQATDLGEGESRFATAKRLIRGRIDSMSDQQSAMLITFSDRAETVQSFTNDRNRLLGALDRIQVTSRPTELLEALRAAEGLANPRRSSEVGDVADVQVADAQPAELIIFSDGGFPDVVDFNVGNLVPTYISLGTDRVRNLAVTEFSAQRDLEVPNRVQVFGTVINLGSEVAESEVELEMEGRFLDAERIKLEPGEERGLAFDIVSESAASLVLKLTEADDLTVDNTAYTGLTPTRTASILVVTRGNSALNVGLATEKVANLCDVTFVSPDFLATEAYRARSETGDDDLIIFDRCRPSQMPLSNTFFIGSIPPAGLLAGDSELPRKEDVPNAEEGAEQISVSAKPNEIVSQTWGWSGEAKPLTIIDIDRAHPLMRYLELYSLLVYNGRALTVPQGAKELLVADIGTVMAIAPREGFQDVVLGFEIVSESEDGNTLINTNWYAERTWPIFLFNLLRTVGNATETTTATSYRPGETVRARLEQKHDGVSVQSDSGTEPTFFLRNEVQFETVDTEDVGNYSVVSDGTLLHRYSVNLFDRQESSIVAKKNLELGYETVQAGNVGLIVRKEFWRFALLLMLIVLAAEWWLYSRRLI